MTYPSVGSFVAGRYRIDSVLGEGGMGAVFAATDASGQRFALKFPSPEMRVRPGMMGRFANEAVATARIASDHVVKVFGVEATEQGVPFMVMELLEGTDLDQILEKQAPVDTPRAVHFALGILRALQVAHTHGVVHRDLKPSNVFVIRHGNDPEHVKLIDFGITKLLDEGGSKTATSLTMGTPAYMSPEQAKSAKAAEPRSDLYSVGVILYELLTKKRPYDGDSNNDIVVKICTEPPLPIRDARPDLPKELAKVVEHALVKAPSGRYDNAVAFVNALEPWADARSAGVLAEIRSGVPPLAPDIVVGTGRGQTAQMEVAATDPGASEPGRPVQRTVVADGPIMFNEPPPAMPYTGGTEMGAPAPLPPNGAWSPPNALPPSAAPAVIPSSGSGGYERPRKGGNGALLAILGVAAVGLIGTGVYFAAFSGSSSTPPAPPAAEPATKKAPAEDEADDDDEPTKKKKKKNTDPGEDPAEPDPTVAPVGPTSTVVAPTKPKVDAGVVASVDAGPPKVDAAPPPAVDASPVPTTTGTTTAPTLVWPPGGWKLPPSTSTAPPATTTAPPATTTAPPAVTIPPINKVPKKPKMGGK